MSFQSYVFSGDYFVKSSHTKFYYILLGGNQLCHLTRYIMNNQRDNSLTITYKTSVGLFHLPAKESLLMTARWLLQKLNKTKEWKNLSFFFLFYP